ncbi:hypothetical protein F8M41_014450 [Gigaspora margarita]|uniref:Uncharacterized protein n=1 Tax=Gigaspora margarita TaxID=4874 RepID=A0A8H4ENZ0_GIGMA|nr:hypothetical protein F8M41_014450 [Gigaspora margarita]
MDIIEENINNQLMEEDEEENIDNQLIEDEEENIDNQLIEKYDKETTGSKVIQKLDLLIQYYSELENILESLHEYNACEKHYNQFKEKLEKLTNQLKECEQQRLFDINLIKELETNNNNLKTENNQLMVKINQLINENNQLKEIINFNFNDQQIHNQERFSLENLLLYTPLDWLSKRNPVIVEFIKTISCNKNETQLIGEKLFKCAIAIDAIYGTRNLKYVSAINLAALAIKYTFARSKSIIDIDNHIISSGSYSKFIK